MIVNPSFGGGEECKLPSGGTAGQVLAKKSAADNDTEWRDVPKPVGLLPGGGATGQILAKKSAAEGDAEWINAPGVPSGVIVMWSGSTSNIPSGWVLCNGSNGTPDLRNRFIVGAGSSYSVGNTGGSDTVTLTVDQMPQHGHKTQIHQNDDSKNTYTSAFATSNVRVNIDEYYGTFYAGGSQPHENRPPYYALCFIMKQ